ncbi:hypothetical protein [Cribrihabitans neustonicus]|uniref:hypothetical protein n=1 Tax=Cribrihabitans neustonicus TaxID=1429085 RepID=UPI003B5CDFDE
MSRASPQPRGGAAVGQLGSLPPLEAGAVVNFRHWFSGPDARAQLRADFEDTLGPAAGQAAFETFGTLCNFCATHGRRPLVRHGLTCVCLGADEACFANLVAAAAEGAEDDARLLAALIVRPAEAPALAELAAHYADLLHQPLPPLQQAAVPLARTLH